MADPAIRGDDDGRGDVLRDWTGVLVHSGSNQHEISITVRVAAHRRLRELDRCAYR